MKTPEEVLENPKYANLRATLSTWELICEAMKEYHKEQRIKTNKTVTVPLYIIDNAKEAVRIAANILNSRKRETAADRQIEFAERLLNWAIEGQVGDPPSYIPKH